VHVEYYLGIHLWTEWGDYRGCGLYWGDYYARSKVDSIYRAFGGVGENTPFPQTTSVLYLYESTVFHGTLLFVVIGTLVITQ
jgi:hypothetical protein